MIVRRPDYYDEFVCKAGECKHTCCMSWEIDIDDKSYEYYCSIGGEFGEKLRNSITKKEKTYFHMYHGKCPFLDENQLCDVYKKLGENALCEVCTEYPRFDYTYGERKEEVLALSCEEVGRILFTKKNKIQFFDTNIEQSENEGITQGNAATSFMESARNACIELLQERSLSLEERIIRFLHISGQMQKCLDQKTYIEMDQLMNEGKKELTERKRIPLADQKLKHRLFQKRMDAIMDLEVMEEEWSEETNNVVRAFYSEGQEKVYETIASEFRLFDTDGEVQYEHLLVYFVYRYLMLASKQGDFLNQAKFCVLCYLVIRDMDRMRYLIQGHQFSLEDRINTVRIFCKEVEHSEKSRNCLMEKIASEDVFNMEQMILQV